MIYFKLFWTFFKIGAFTFGGGYAMLPLIQGEVLKNGWISADELLNFIAVSESTPGPFAINIATYVGTTLNGFWGAISSTLGVILPSFLIILFIARFFEKFSENSIVKGVMSGLKPAVIGLILSAVLSVGKTVLLPEGLLINKNFYLSLGIFVISAVLIFKKLHPIYVILISALLGILSGLIFAI
ncbi:MAG: chromate transporter [Clostridia bacterium]|nr:chromate transporter [Clostridia bacterium]